MADFGVTPTGFAIKRLPEIKADLERAAKLIFGQGLIVTPQSPMGQFIGFAADLAAQGWEIGLDTYQSFDVDQAEGNRLDMLGKVRLMERATGEDDADYRRAITNIDRARIDTADIQRAIIGLPGVTYAKVYVNDEKTADEHGIPGNTVALAVMGGEDAEIAATLRQYVVPGISTYGNVRAETTVGGVCRTVKFTRPAPVELWLEITVRAYYDRNGCPPPGLGAIAVGFLTDIQGNRRPDNDDDITDFLIRSIIEGRYTNVEFVSARAGLDKNGLVPLPFAIIFDQIASFSADRLIVLSVD